jgi:pilus assembly protein CpaF
MAHKIILVIGPQQGVGKTTLAANLAAQFAQHQHQPVLCIDTDLDGRGSMAQISGTTPAISLTALLDQLVAKVALPILRGRVPTNPFNIGTIPYSTNGKAPELSAEQLKFFLETYSQLYDLVVDMEFNHPHLTTALDTADLIVWTLLPNPVSLKTTIQQLDALQNQKYSFHRFIFVVNQAGGPNAIATDSISRNLARFQKEPIIEFPYDPEIPRLAKSNQPSINQKASGYLNGAMKLVKLIPKYQAETRASIAPANQNGRPKDAAGNPERAVVDEQSLENLKRWNVTKQQLHRELVEELNVRRIDLDTKGDLARERQLRSNVESTVNALIGKEKDLVLTREDRERLVKELVDEALGLGPLEELLADPAVTEIMVNRFDQVYIERRGKISLSDKRFIDNNHVVQVIRRIISPLGRRIDESVPMVDARLKDGSRVNAIIPPLAVQGPSITIRRFPEKALSAEDLVRSQSISAAMVEFLKICVQTKKNIVISGGTGTGKTTILNMLSGFIPGDERIVTVEDTAELRMQQEHVVRLEARPANIEGQGQVTIRDLVKNCLRMRPDRIVVGECRGGEALDMLQAMNTGHDGSLTTVHANSPRDAFTRLETLCLMAGMDLPVWALREQIRSAIHILVQLSRLQDGTRKVTCVTEVTGRDEEQILTQDLFRFIQDGMDAQGKVVGHYEAPGNVPKFFHELKAKGLTLDASLFNAEPSRTPERPG